MATHWAYADARTRGTGRYEEQITLCSQWAPLTGIVAEPTCPLCTALLIEQASQPVYMAEFLTNANDGSGRR